MPEINDDYTALWKEVEALDKEGLPKSALEKVEVIFAKAKKEQNTPQIIKALIYKGKYTNTLEEDGLVVAINQTRTEMENSTFPAKQLLQSVLAEMYSRYLDNFYWQFRDRTETLDYTPEDIRTWSVDRFVEESTNLYEASVNDKRLQELSIKGYEAILNKTETLGQFRPTLYDFLVHRAINHFSNQRNYLTEPVYKFYVNQEAALADVNTFVNHNFETKDKASKIYRAILLYQEALRFHANDEDPTALIDLDLRRLGYLYNQSILTNKNEIYLKSLESLSQKYSAHSGSAEVDYNIADYYFQTGNQYKLGPSENGKWDWKKALEICEATIKKYPDSYGASFCQKLKNNILTKNLTLQTEQVNLRDQPFLALVNYRNIDKIYLKIAPITEKDEKGMGRLYDKDLVKFYNDLKPLKVWAEDLPQVGDYRNHSVEIKIDKLPPGKYVVLASDTEKFTNKEHGFAHMTTHISNIAYMQSTGDGTRLVVMDRDSGAPLSGVKATFYKTTYNNLTRKNDQKLVSTQTSDSNGFVNNIPSSDRESYTVKFEKGDDFLYLNQAFSNYRGRDRDYPDNTVAHFFLDRAIYRPGQTVYYKALVLSVNDEQMPRILPNKKVVAILKDANWQEVERVTLTTNEYGTVNGTFTTPRGGLLGTMSIQMEGIGSKQFRVEEYKRPKFEVTFQDVEGSYKLGDEVTVKGNAKAFAGSNVDGAKVTYRVVREVRYPYLPWYYYRWGGYESNSMEITNDETTTDENGEFEVTFTAEPDQSVSKESKPRFIYQVYADVTDITGESHSNNTTVVAADIALQVDINVPELINRDSLKSFGIDTKNLNGVFEGAKGKVTISQLTTPAIPFRQRHWQKPDQFIIKEDVFKKSFPYDAYKDEDEIQNWKINQAVFNGNFDTNEDKKLAIQSATWKPGKYVLKLSTQDKYGAKIEIEKHFTLYDLDERSNNFVDANNLISEKNSYQPEETAHAYFGSGLKEVHLFVETQRQRKIEKSEWKKVNGLEKLSFPINESDRGNMHFLTQFVKHNRFYNNTRTIQVPWTNKQLKMEYATFRNKLLPGQEEKWQLKISGSKKDKVAAEMVAAMYDASLDEFAVNNWALNLFPSFYPSFRWNQMGFGVAGSRLIANDWNPRHSTKSRTYPTLDWFGFGFYDMSARMYKSRAGGRREAMAPTSSVPPPPSPSVMMEDSAVMEEAEGLTKTWSNVSGATDGDMNEDIEDVMVNVDGNGSENTPSDKKETDFSEVKVRTNLDETVFFFPNLQTDEEGNVIIEFTMNEALTRWKFLGLAHTKDLQTAISEKEVVTQKDLMVLPNAPRFFREGDQIEFTAKVSNLTKKGMKGTAVLQLFDAITMQPIDDLLGNQKREIAFDAGAGQSDRLAWNLKIPFGKVQAVTHRVIAKSGNFSDGEESTLPVLTNRMLVTETMPLPVRGNESKTFDFKRMQEVSKSSSMQNHNFTLEFTSNPAWYAIQSLPYLMEYPYECTEQIFNRFYSNSLATSVANSHPKVKRVFETWRDMPIEEGAMMSNLSKNQELKSALLEETPWVLSAQNEEQQKRNIGLLFDLNKMSNELNAALEKLSQRQLVNGGFAWFPGGRDNWYITQYLVEGMGHLDKLNALGDKRGGKSAGMLQSAVRYIDARIVEHYNEINIG